MPSTLENSDILDMPRSLRCTFVRLCHLLSDKSGRLSQHVGGMLDTYFRGYYPLIYLAEVAIGWYQDPKTNSQGTALACLTLVLGLYRSLKLFFPWIHVWPAQDDPSSRYQTGDKPELEEVGKEGAHLPSKSAEDVHWRHVNVDLGLSDAEASRRRRKYGKNLLWTGRNWIWTTLQYTTMAGNVLSEVCPNMCTCFHS